MAGWGDVAQSAVQGMRRQSRPKSASAILATPRMQMRRQGGMGQQMGPGAMQTGGGLQNAASPYGAQPSVGSIGGWGGARMAGASPYQPASGVRSGIMGGWGGQSKFAGGIPTPHAPVGGMGGWDNQAQYEGPNAGSLGGIPMSSPQSMGRTPLDASDRYSASTSIPPPDESRYGTTGQQISPPPVNPITGQPITGNQMPGSTPGGAYGGGTDPYDQPYDVKGKRKFKHANWLKKANRKLPPWLQDQQMFETSMGTINDILNSGGHLSPELLQRQQADIESGRQQGQQALQARLAAAGVDPSSPMYQSMAGTVDQAGNRMQHTARADEDIRAEMQKRQDLQQVIPYLQAMLGLTTKRGGGGVQQVQGGGGGGSPDYLGAGTQIASSILGGWASNGFRTS